MNTPVDIEDALARLTALGQRSRLAVFRHLLAHVPHGQCPGDICAALGIPPATLSFHLRTLAQAGLVHGLQQGRHILYHADAGALRSLSEYLASGCCGGQPEQCCDLSAAEDAA